MAVKGQRKNQPAEETVPIPEPSSTGPAFDRKKLLEITGSLIEETYERVSGDRFRPREGDRERLQYLRALGSLIALQASLLKDAHAPPLDGYQRPKSHLDKLLEDMEFN